MKKDLRLLITLKCNLTCAYCCNNLSEISSKFQYKKLEDLNFGDYRNICISGGEPFLEKELLYQIIDMIPTGKNIYIYTNGLKVSYLDMIVLTYLKNPIVLNVGLHDVEQLDKINKMIGTTRLNVRFMYQDVLEEEMLNRYPERLNKNNSKAWTLNQCEVPNEDWVVLLP